jgi:hypothetical protein
MGGSQRQGSGRPHKAGQAAQGCGMSRADVVQALRDYLYEREAFGDDDLSDLIDTYIVSAIARADELVDTVKAALDIRRYELM